MASTMVELGGGWEKRNSVSHAGTYFLSVSLQVGVTNTRICQMVFTESRMVSLIGRAILRKRMTEIYQGEVRNTNYVGCP